MKASVEKFYEEFDGDRHYKEIPMICAAGLHELIEERAHHHLTQGARVLDVGCGQGALSLRLADGGFQVDACDLVDRCQCKDVVNFIHAKAEEIEFPDEYDGIFVVELVEHVESPYAIFRQYVKNLKPGGYFFVSTPNVESDFSRIWFAVMGEHWHFRKDDIERIGHIMPVFQFQIDYIAEELGLTVVEEKRLPEHRGYTIGLVWLIAKLVRLYRKLKGKEPSTGHVRLWVLRKD